MMLFCQFCFSQQIKVAIVDFDNTSDIAKYDGLGKAMSSMLISDIEANVSPKRLQLVERSQINKILKEQNFQKTSSVEKASTVKMGKLLGVKYLLVGDIFVLNDALVINSRLVDAETADIKFTEKKEGKLSQWLFLKTALAKGLATSISMPFTEPVVLDKEINSAVVTTFSNAITEKDKGNIDKSQELLKIVEEFSADFKYIDDIKAQLEELKKQVKKNTEDINDINKNIDLIITDPIALSNNFINKKDTINAIKIIEKALILIEDNDPYKLNKKITLLSRKLYYLLEKKSLNEAEIIIKEINDIDPYYMDGLILKAKFYLITNNFNEVDKICEFVRLNENIFYTEELKKNSKLLYDKIGSGYIAISGYNLDNNKKRFLHSDKYLLSFEFPNAVLELASEINLNEKTMELLWYKAYNETKDVNFYKWRPFHVFKNMSNLLWTSAKFNPKLGLQLLDIAIEMENYYYNLNSSQFAIYLKENGFIPKDPSFDYSDSKEAFFKDFNYLNYRLNLGHILLLNSRKIDAVNLYCECINNYDQQYIIYSNQMVNDFRQLIFNDWIDLKINKFEIKCQ